MSTSDDYHTQYHSHCPDRGDLYVVVHKTTGKVFSPRPVTREDAEWQRTFVAGDQWSPEQLEKMRARVELKAAELVYGSEPKIIRIDLPPSHDMAAASVWPVQWLTREEALERWPMPSEDESK